MSAHRSSRILSLAALAVAGVALAGCSAQPGTAAVIDGTRITIDDVDVAQREFVEITGQSDAQPRAVLNTLMAAQVLPDVAAGYGIAYSDEQITDIFAEQLTTAGNEVPEGGFADSTLELGRYLFVLTDVQSSPDGQAIAEAFGARMKEAKTVVNPRYGEIDENGLIAPVTHDWIAPATPQ
ncbi:MAG: SurA N-terminal domain-containing protein [Georgenia sp.]